MTRNISIQSAFSQPVGSREFEICEHKGIGHPDTLTDGVCEAASRALSQRYQREFGRVLHHNLDKGLLLAGRSEPRFGGGRRVGQRADRLHQRQSAAGLRTRHCDAALQRHLVRHRLCTVLAA